jgi:beta-mannosidase
MQMKKFLFIFFFFGFLNLVNGQQIIRSLNEALWHFSQVNSLIKFKAKVPGTIHSDLFANKLIPDPFYGNNEKQLQWIEKEAWDYFCSFEIKENTQLEVPVYLRCKGLDTYASLYVNDSLIGEANNMFCTWEFEIAKYLKQGNNNLRIRFYSAQKICDSLAKQNSVLLPGGTYAYARKAAYQFGWDWAPRYVTCGIWKAIELVWEEGNYMEDILVKQEKLDTTLALVNLAIQLGKPASGDEFIKINIADLDTTILYPLTLGSSQITCKINIPKPQLWWCNGLGKPYLYKFKISLHNKLSTLAETTQSIGLRTVEWVQEEDTFGKSFYMKLNGKPVFVKGSNWVPMHSFPSEVGIGKMNHLLQLAAEANLNMLRVWGGGYYEADNFYKRCDELGILVWQDFMFAGAMYPSNDVFLSNVSKEIEEQVMRLRNHPCIAIWCGNNEIEEAWFNWGWQKQLKISVSDSIEIWTGYQKLFRQQIPRQLASLDPARYYHPSSPTTGWGRKEAYTQGDVHYWGVWWGEEPFDKYKEKVGRFVSEYGFQGFPFLSTLAKYIDSTDLNLDSASFKNHQKHPRGFELIERQMQLHGLRPRDINEYALDAALLQAKALQTAIEAHRFNTYKCLGSLFWQWNDCWPAISWSVVDYLGQPKAAYYTVKKAFSPNLVLLEPNGKYLMYYFIQEDLSINKFQLKANYFNIEGKLLFGNRMNQVCVSAVQPILGIDTTFLDSIGKGQPLVIRMTISINDSMVCTSDYLHKPKLVYSGITGIRTTYDEKKKLVSVTNTNNFYTTAIYLEREGYIFSDNLFGLMPGETKEIGYRKFSLALD